MPEHNWLGGLSIALSESSLQAAVGRESWTWPSKSPRPVHHCFLLNFPSPPSRGHQRNSVPSCGAWVEGKLRKKWLQASDKRCNRVKTTYCDWDLLWSCPEINFYFSVLPNWLKLSLNTVHWSCFIISTKIIISLWIELRSVDYTLCRPWRNIRVTLWATII